MSDTQPRWGSRRTLAAVALVAAVVLAGCGAGGQPTTAPDADISADDVRADVLSVADGADSYAINGTTNATVLANNQEQQVTVESETRVDRASQAFATDRTTQVLGRTTEVEGYLQDGVFYQRSDAFVQAYSSEWVKQDVSGNVSRAFRTVDLLQQVEVGMENATSLSLNGTAQVDGTEAYVLEAEVNGSAVEAYALGSLQSSGLGGSVNVTDAALTVYASTESGQPLRVVSTTNASLSLQGQRIDVRSVSDARITAEPVSVTLPEGASTAVNASAALGS
ncbi:MAG: hypothetical protein ACI9CA_001852 [Natronomonas sp.]|jgi:hypothetical protein